MKTAILLLSVLFLTGSPLWAQEEVTVTTIRVWVTVQSSGKAMETLNQSNFEITEDGKKMTPTCFERAGLLDLSGQEPAAPDEEEISPSRMRVVLLIDQIGTSPAEYAFIKPKLKEFVDQIRGKADVMLAAVPPFEPLVPFGRDYEEIRSALETIDVRRDRDMTIAQRRRDIRDFVQQGRPESIAAAYQLAAKYQAEEVQETMILFDAFNDFRKYLNRLQQEDHTVVVFVSGGINSKPGQHYFDLIEESTRVDEGLRTLSRNMPRIENIQKETIGRLNRENTTIYTINTRGQVDVMDNITEKDKQFMGKGDVYRAELQEVLDHIANETGGVSFRNSLNFRKGLDTILTDLDQQYLLCYVAPEHKNLGDYHKIKVSVKGPKVKIRHRAGYVD